MNYDGSEMRGCIPLLFAVAFGALLVAFTVGVICGSVWG